MFSRGDGLVFLGDGAKTLFRGGGLMNVPSTLPWSSCGREGGFSPAASSLGGKGMLSASSHQEDPTPVLLIFDAQIDFLMS